MVYLARGGFWVTLNQAVSGVLSLVLIIAFANLLPKDTYGLYRYILSIAGILSIFTLTGMNSAVSRTVARGGEGSLQTSVRYQMKWNVMMLFAFFILGGYYYIKDDITLAISFFILGSFIPFSLAFNTYGAYLEGKKEFKLSSTLSIISTLIYSIGILLTMLLSEDVVWLVAVYAVSTFIPSLIFYFYTLHTFKPPLHVDASETLQYGRTLTYIRLLAPITSQIDKVILAHFWGPAQLATYSLATAIPSKGVPALKKIVDIGFPKFASSTSEKINAVFYTRIVQGMIIGLGVAAVYILLAPFLFRYLLPQYLEGIYYSQLLALSFIFALPTRYISLLFESQRMSQKTFLANTVNSVLAILLYMGFGIFGGLLGLVLAGVLHSFLGFVVNLTTWKLSTRSSVHQ